MKAAKVHYIHSLSYSTRDKLAGTFVLVALLLVLGLFVSKVKLSKIFDSVVTYQAVMKNAQGITTETAINISGIDVGRVQDIYLDDSNKVNIHFFVYKRFQALIRADSTGEVSRLSLVGDNIIIIKAGSHNQPMLPDNALIAIKEPTVTNYLAIAEITPAINKFTSMITTVSDVLETINSTDIRQSSRNIQNVLADLRNITHQVAEGKGSVGRILYDKEQEQHLVNSIALLEKTLSGVAKTIEQIEPIIANANHLAVASKQVVADANKLTTESQQLIVDVRKSVSHVEQQLSSLPALINTAQSVLQTTDDTLNGLQPVHVMIDNQIWPLSSNSSSKPKDLLIESEGLDE